MNASLIAVTSGPMTWTGLDWIAMETTGSAISAAMGRHGSMCRASLSRGLRDREASVQHSLVGTSTRYVYVLHTPSRTASMHVLFDLNHNLNPYVCCQKWGLSCCLTDQALPEAPATSTSRRHPVSIHHSQNNSLYPSSPSNNSSKGIFSI